MIDEKQLQQRLQAAAAAQDDLLPRALDDDLTAGRRRLRRRQLLTGGGVTAAVAAVAVVAVGVNGWLTPNANPLPGNGPVAGQPSTIQTMPPGGFQPDPDATRDTPIPADQEPPVPARDAAFNQALTAAMYAHLDPGKKHLDFSSGGFTVDRQLGTILSGGNRIGWRMPGQKGAEGIAALGIQPKTRTPRPCGSTTEPRLTCHPVTLPNGRTAQLGRQGDTAEVLYQQPDGEWVDIAITTLFGNNSEIPVHDMGITDQMLFALVQDNRLNLPKLTQDEQSNEEKLKNYKPAKAQVRAAAVSALPGSTLTGDRWEDVTEQVTLSLNWHQGAVTATIEVGVDSSVAVSPCDQQLSILTKCAPLTLPDGKKVMYGEKAMNFAGGPKYVVGGTYLQPDGDSAFVRVLYPGNKLPAGGITKEQLLTLLTDPRLDK